MTKRTLVELSNCDEFLARHIGPNAADLAAMLQMVGATTMADLIDQAIPASIRWSEALALPAPRSEAAVLAELADIAGRNTIATSLIGMGYYGTHTPGVILRNVLENPAWYTAYTPYQPEISQGRLEALLNYQTMVSDLTGLDISNASMLDEATAAAEAMTLCRRSSKGRSELFFVDADCHPQTIAVVRTRAEPIGIEVIVGDPWLDLSAHGPDPFAVLVQYPGSGGEVRDLRPVAAAVHDRGGFLIVATDLLALTLLASPGEQGADVAVGSSQRFGVPLGFGGPHAGFLATRDLLKRSLPGRLVGTSVDAAGNPANRLALQTREQHIRREKATSNICTAQVLLAVIASMYAVYHGPDGLAQIARRTHRLTAILAAGLREGRVRVLNDQFFDTLTVSVNEAAWTILATGRRSNLNLRFIDENTVGISLDETSTAQTVEAIWATFGIAASIELLDQTVEDSWPQQLTRTTPYLTNPVFNRYHSETEMLRYLRRLADRDVALDRAMIPLGSCTMKLNATTEMTPVTWPAFGQLHPFAPLDQAAGYLQLISELEEALAEITGYDAVSLQPNAGSQGELAGLLAIRSYHRHNGDANRDVCLIPSSAHGTNAASAVMAGMSVVVVACDRSGNVDLVDLDAKAASHADRLAAVMVTYPSTHGVFEETITAICAVVHNYGGQVYVDGANLNALVGLAKPGKFGADVSHLNLHKTFCIPHGGGGPGIGPVAVKAHLAPFLPGSCVVPEVGSVEGSISAAPWGSASILPISWAYIRLMGADGLRRATEMAILSANYMATRLDPHFPVLFTGSAGRVAHECILDLRPITAATGVTVEDVAKRLIDYGFHAPTMSFPVAGTLMVEPTESESKAELDRFCDAMIAIRAEIDRVASGEWPLADNPLGNSPHTAESLLVAEWTHPYTREEAAYPTADLRLNKYWPPVGRIDGAYGDRHLVCSCPPLDAYESI